MYCDIDRAVGVNVLIVAKKILVLQTSPKFVWPVSFACRRAADWPVNGREQVIHRSLKLLKFVKLLQTVDH